MPNPASLAVLVAGCVVIVVAGTGAVLARDIYTRLHFLSPVTSLGAPCVGISAMLADGVNLATASIVLTILLLMLSGPALAAATARAAAQRDELVETEPPQ